MANTKTLNKGAQRAAELAKAKAHAGEDEDKGSENPTDEAEPDARPKRTRQTRYYVVDSAREFRSRGQCEAYLRENTLTTDQAVLKGKLITPKAVHAVILS